MSGRDKAAAPLPALTPWNRFYWQSGEAGVLRMQRCRSCTELLFPPGPRCPTCQSTVFAVEDLSGRGVVEAFTVNHQQWHPAITPPYVVAIVALAEDAAVRITTNIVNCALDDVFIGMPVRVAFEHRDDVWLPRFEPDPEVAPRQPALAESMVASRDRQHPRRPFASIRRADKFESKVVISGIGQSAIGRRLDRDPLGLMVDAALAAIADAGLTREDIDGMSSYPGGSVDSFGGDSGGGIFTMEEALRIRPLWFSSGMETSGQTGAVVNAMLAVASGLCRHAVCVRGVWAATFQDLQRRGELRGAGVGGGARIGGEMSWRLPYGAFSAANWIGMMANRHMAYYGTTREQLGAIALNARANAMRNPDAVYRDPLTMDDYLSARPVTTPFGLYDCDVPCDGAVAVVVSHVDTVPDLRAPIVRVEAVGTALNERISWDQGTLLHEPVLRGAAQHLWSRTEMHPGDVDVAEIYDGFTFNCLSWLEMLGFCAPGEGGPFVEGGKRIALDGELPLNTHGGQLSAGRLHGYGFLHEACVQLRGEGGARQVRDVPEVAVVTTGGGHPGGAWLLTRDR
ncbi:MAG TPA: OB-fold domain-containing protein [Acidimicrobiales bacterium]|nr:OB-fold domain-containing protein [Acidimicrobiales bacterium]